MSSGVSQLYKSVIDDVINNVREVFLDESLDEHILQELKQCWENKLLQSKAVPPEGVQAEDRIMPAPFTIQTQPPQTTSAGNTQVAVKTARGIQYKYATAVQQQLPAGSIVQPTLQYQYAQGDMPDGSKTVTITLPQNLAGSQKPVTISLPASAIMQQGGLVMSTAAATAASALPHGITAGLLQPGIATINASNLIAHPNSGKELGRLMPKRDGSYVLLNTCTDGTLQYQTVTTEQLAKQGYTTVNVPQAPGAQTTSQVQQVQLQNEPLNSEDDVSDEDPSELFDTDNVIVCQYDKITRSRNKWKFHLKDGIMNLQGKDFVFQRASGDAEW
uniref:Transcription initiation factor IIA subunit 1 n=1 Tax=Strigamia maritima TaxID=126957 RepID=T1ITQ5_STRMM